MSSLRGPLGVCLSSKQGKNVGAVMRARACCGSVMGFILLCSEAYKMGQTRWCEGDEIVRRRQNGVKKTKRIRGNEVERYIRPGGSHSEMFVPAPPAQSLTVPAIFRAVSTGSSSCMGGGYKGWAEGVSAA